MSVNQVPSNIERAKSAWGDPLPRWVDLLAQACDQSNQRLVAQHITANGFRCSSGTVSRLVNRLYGASYAEPERAVLAVYGADEVDCPVFGAIPLAACIRNRRRKARPQHESHFIFAAACPTCPKNTDKERS